MAESSATATYTEIRNAVAKWLFQGTTYAALSAANTVTAAEIVSRGFRLYMAPPILPGERNAHVWSWIRPETTLVVAKGDPSGTHTTDPGTGTTLTDTAATFETGWDTQGSNGQHELIGRVITTKRGTTGTTFTNTITAVASATTLTTTGNAFDASIIVTDTYTIEGDGNWNLPDDHGGIVGNLTFDATTNFPPVKQTSEARIRNLRQNSLIDQTQRPHLFSVRPRQSTVSSTGGNSELVLWPRPDTTYTFHYRYVKLFDEATSGDVFPGGLRSSECAMAAALAVAERFADPTTPVSGKQWDYFIETLRSAVSLDRQEMFADNLGPNLDRSDDVFHDHLNRFGGVTYLGVSYPT